MTLVERVALVVVALLRVLLLEERTALEELLRVEPEELRVALEELEERVELPEVPEEDLTAEPEVLLPEEERVALEELLDRVALEELEERVELLVVPLLFRTSCEEPLVEELLEGLAVVALDDLVDEVEEEERTELPEDPEVLEEERVELLLEELLLERVELEELLERVALPVFLVWASISGAVSMQNPTNTEAAIVIIFLIASKI